MYHTHLYHKISIHQNEEWIFQSNLISEQTAQHFGINKGFTEIVLMCCPIDLNSTNTETNIYLDKISNYAHTSCKMHLKDKCNVAVQ